MIWFDVKDDHGGKAKHGIVNADHVVSIFPTYDHSMCVIKTTDEKTWISETPYAEMRVKLRELKNKGTK